MARVKTRNQLFICEAARPSRPLTMAKWEALFGIVKLLEMIWSPGNSRRFPDAISTDPTLRPPVCYP